MDKGDVPSAESQQFNLFSNDPELDEILSGFVSCSSSLLPDSPLSLSSSSSSDIEIQLKTNSETEEIATTNEPPLVVAATSLSKKSSITKGIPQSLDKIPPNVRLPIRKGGMHLWQFLYAMLLEPNEYSNLIEWTTNRESYEFRLLEPEAIAMWWGYHKNKKNMSYDKLSRSLRYYYDKCIIRKMSGERYVYRFCIDPELMYSAIGNSENRPQLKPLPVNIKYMLLSKTPAKDKSPIIAEEAEHVSERYQRKRSSPEYSPAALPDTSRRRHSFSSYPISPNHMPQQQVTQHQHTSPLHYSTPSSSSSSYCCTAESSYYHDVAMVSPYMPLPDMQSSTSSYQHFNFPMVPAPPTYTATDFSSPLSHYSENIPENNLYFFNQQTSVTTRSYDTTTNEYPFYHLQQENQLPIVQYTTSASTSTAPPLLDSLSTSVPQPYELFNIPDSNPPVTLWAGEMQH